MAERHSGQHDVVYVVPAAPQQPRVLEPRNALTNRKLTHCSPLYSDRPTARRHSGARAKRASPNHLQKRMIEETLRVMDSGFAPFGAPRNDAGETSIYHSPSQFG